MKSTVEPRATSPTLGPQLFKLSRDMVELLVSQQGASCCRLPLTRFLTAYQRHFRRQFRAADYGSGLVSLTDLIDSIPHVIHVRIFI